MDIAMKRRRVALCVLFLLPGLGISSWVTRTPAIRDALGASTAEMGMVLFGLSAGSMLGILGSGVLVARFGARPVIVFGTLAVILSMPTIGMGAALSTALLVAFGLFLFGLGMGGGEVAMNVEGADIEKTLSLPLLPRLHGFFSLGTVIGALAGMTFTATGFSVAWHLVIVGVLALVAAVATLGSLPPGTGRTYGRASTEAPGGRTRALWKDTRLVLIGVIVLAMALAEGTANDWLPLIMVDGHGFDQAMGSMVYAVFAASMTVGRFAGGYFLARFGRSRVLAASAAAGVAGMGLVAGADSQVLAAAAVVLWGLGASLGFPVALSAAGDSGPDSAARVALVATVGYIAFLVGPPVLGFVGEEHGLRAALLLPLLFVAFAGFLSPAARPRTAVATTGERDRVGTDPE
ncbi:MFS transporter [Nocardiopsis sp. MG754419]|uniref:MFS transporter n=1 Tax=Nocardiopsis sp. MG754419 TaxID=2259865 RepID=UPI001BABA1B7|nr:MFS transporter [Nocardiopsis sp. MG754419]MBR8742293.1 MFS transporter [Nocardiopsis sp. MG754419]